MRGKRSILSVFVLCIMMLIVNLLQPIAPIVINGREIVTAAAKKTESENYDTFFLKKDASFKRWLADGVYCVPVNVLGKPEYTDEEILDMIDTRDPKNISKKIDTLYDSIRYHYLSGFKTLRSDHKDLAFEGVIWQHHKSGREALLTNEGDCSGNAVLIQYLLDGDYDETGFFSYNLKDGGGHVFNYIKQDNKYYFLDFTVICDAIMESKLGSLQEPYCRSNLVVADSVEKFVAYYKKQFLGNMTSVFNTYTADRVAPIGYKNGTYYLPDDLENIKFYGDKKQISIKQTKKPEDIPCWNRDGLLDRELQADISIVPYSSQEYEGRGSSFELRFYLMNDVTARLTGLTMKYYNANDVLMLNYKYTEPELYDYIYFNTSIFTWRPFPLWQDNYCSYAKGVAEFTDIHDNVFTKEFQINLK